MTRADLSRPRRIHVVGIGGAGMSSIATVLLAMGHRVSGSDLKSSPGLERLRGLGVDVHVGHDAAHIGDAEVLAVSTAVPPANPEVRAAEAAGVAVLSRSELLSAVAGTRRTIAVAGTHGKTTTSSMLSLVLLDAGMRPSFIVGGELNEIGSGAAWSDGEWLVVEADESDGTFLELSPEVAVVTSVEPDHLDHYGSFDELVAAFGRFLAGASGTTVVSADDPRAAALGRRAGSLSFGTASEADYRMVGAGGSRSGYTFALEHAGDTVVEVQLSVPGLHNARNAAAAAVTALAVGAEPDAVAHALARFTGVARRFQFRGEAAGVTFVDDYAHLPGEVEPVIAAAGDGGWERIVCVFQPHRYSRTAALWPDFAHAFDGADVLVVTDVYGAGEAPRPGVSGRLIADAVLAADPGRDVEYVPDRAALAERVAERVRPGDLCLTLGAGDLTSLPDELLARLR